MGTYCVSCKKHTPNRNSSVKKANQGRLMLLSNCAVFGKKKSTFIKNKELNNISNDQFKINKIIKKFSLTTNKFMPELHFKNPGFTKHLERIQKFRVTGNFRHL